MKTNPNGISPILKQFASTSRKQEFFVRIFKIRPKFLSASFGAWYQEIQSWRKNVDEFDRLLLGILQQKKIGLHFSSGNWDMSLDKDPSLKALQTGEDGELRYYAINPKRGEPKLLNLFPKWANRYRNYLIVIDREQEKVEGIEPSSVEQKPLQEAEIIRPAHTPIFYRSEWLIKEPIPIFSLLDFMQPEKVELFGRLALIYQSKWGLDWAKELKKSEERERINFYLMLFSVANGLRLIEALEHLEKE